MIDAVLFTVDDQLSLDFQQAHRRGFFGTFTRYKSAKHAKFDIAYIDHRMPGEAINLCYNLMKLHGCIIFGLIDPTYCGHYGFDLVGLVSDSPKNLLKQGYHEILHRIASCQSIRSEQISRLQDD